MDLVEIQELIRILEASQLSEIEVEEEGRRIRLKKPGESMPAGITMVPHATAPPAAAHVFEPESADSAGEPGDRDDDLTTIKSPMVGTFYAAPAPDQPPFVQMGDAVEENQVVCIVEAMKLKNEVSAKFPAVIEEILVQNGEPVEFGQPLFVVRPIV